MNYKEIANNYIMDRDYFENIEEYVEHYKLNVKIKTLKFYIKVEESIQNNAIKSKVLKELFTNNVAIKFINKNDNNRFAIFHPYTKGNTNKYQISFIDDKGAEMDLASPSIDNIIEKFLSYYNKYDIISEKI